MNTTINSPPDNATWSASSPREKPVVGESVDRTIGGFFVLFVILITLYVIACALTSSIEGIVLRGLW